MNTNRHPIEERVYETLCGVLIPAARVPWVGSIAEPGLRYFEAYEEMHRAYERLRLRLGAEDEDADVEEIISCLLERERCIALKMFEYGRLYQQMQNRLEKK